MVERRAHIVRGAVFGGLVTARSLLYVIRDGANMTTVVRTRAPTRALSNFSLTRPFFRMACPSFPVDRRGRECSGSGRSQPFAFPERIIIEGRSPLTVQILQSSFELFLALRSPSQQIPNDARRSATLLRDPHQRTPELHSAGLFSILNRRQAHKEKKKKERERNT